MIDEEAKIGRKSMNYVKNLGYNKLTIIPVIVSMIYLISISC